MGDRIVDLQPSITQLRSAVTERGDNKEKFRKDHDERKSALEADATTIEGKVSLFSEAKTAQDEGNKKIEEKTKELLRAHSKGIDITGVDTVDQLIQKHTDIIYKDGPDSIKARLDKIEQANADEISKIVADKSTITEKGKTREDEKYSDARRLINDKWEAERKRVHTLRVDLENQLYDLQTNLSEIEGLEKSKVGDENKEAKLEVEDLRRDYDAMTNMGLSNAELSTQSVAELMGRANAQHEADVAAGITPPRGWAEGDNLKEAQRSQLLNAVVEAKAREPILADQSLDPNILVMYSTLQGLGISEFQLRSLNPDEIAQKVNDISRLGRGGWNARRNNMNRPLVEGAKKVAERLMGNRADAYSRLRRDHRQQAVIEGELAEPAGIEQFIGQANDVISLMDKQGEVFARVRNVFSEAPLRDETLDVAPIPAGGDYSQQERDLAAPQGYYEMIDLIFDYRNNPDRGRVFERISTLLPPQDLADVLYNSDRLALPVALAGATIDVILAQLQADFAAGDLNARDMRAVVPEVIDHLRARVVSQL